MQRLAGVIAILALVACLGCPKPVDKSKPKTLVEWFKYTQADAKFEDGPIVMDSVHLKGEDTIVYETEKNGVRKFWKVQYRRNDEGEFKRVGELIEYVPKDS